MENKTKVASVADMGFLEESSPIKIIQEVCKGFRENDLARLNRFYPHAKQINDHLDWLMKRKHGQIDAVLETAKIMMLEKLNDPAQSPRATANKLLRTMIKLNEALEILDE